MPSGAHDMALAIEILLPVNALTQTQTSLTLLIERAASGDTAAFEQIMIHSQQRVMAMTWRMLGNEADARDASQEVFLRVYKHLGRFKQDQDFFRVGTGVNRGSGLNHTALGFSSTLQLDRMLPLTGLELPVTVTVAHATDVPKYRTGSDVVLDRARSDIETLKALTESLMPERILDDLDEQQIRDLLSYVQSKLTTPVPGGVHEPQRTSHRREVAWNRQRRFGHGCGHRSGQPAYWLRGPGRLRPEYSRSVRSRLPGHLYGELRAIDLGQQDRQPARAVARAGAIRE